MGAGHSELGGDAPNDQRHEGWLTKESETLKTWNPRWCVLAKAELRWWDDEAMAKDGQPPRGKVSLRYARVSAAADAAHVDALCIETAGGGAAGRLFFQAPSAGAAAAWLRALRVASREPWEVQPPGGGDICPVCRLAPLSLFHRHHCRRCGALVCSGCSAAVRALPDLDYAQPVRVCTPCAGEDGPLLPPAERAAAAVRALPVHLFLRRSGQRASWKVHKLDCRKLGRVFTPSKQ